MIDREGLARILYNDIVEQRRVIETTLHLDKDENEELAAVGFNGHFNLFKLADYIKTKLHESD